jgi:hypothetical protein
MTSQNVWKMSLFQHFFKVLSLHLEARIRIRIRIKVKGRIRTLSCRSSCVSPVELTDGRDGGGGVGVEPNHTTAIKPGPLSIIQYSLGSTIWLFLFLTVTDFSNSASYLSCKLAEGLWSPQWIFSSIYCTVLDSSYNYSVNWPMVCLCVGPGQPVCVWALDWTNHRAQ